MHDAKMASEPEVSLWPDRSFSCRLKSLLGALRAEQTAIELALEKEGFKGSPPWTKRISSVYSIYSIFSS